MGGWGGITVPRNRASAGESLGIHTRSASTSDGTAGGFMGFDGTGSSIVVSGLTARDLEDLQRRGRSQHSKTFAPAPPPTPTPQAGIGGDTPARKRVHNSIPNSQEFARMLRVAGGSVYGEMWCTNKPTTERWSLQAWDWCCIKMALAVAYRCPQKRGLITGYSAVRTPNQCRNHPATPPVTTLLAMIPNWLWVGKGGGEGGEGEGRVTDRHSIARQHAGRSQWGCSALDRRPATGGSLCKRYAPRGQRTGKTLGKTPVPSVY